MGKGITLHQLPRGGGKSTLAKQLQQIQQAVSQASGVSSAMMGGQRREHPLEFVSGYKFIAREKRWGNVPVYKVCTKIISEIMRCELAPHAELTRWRMLDEIESQVGPNVCGIAWIRRARKEEIELVVTTALMLDRVPVILRAFEP